MTKFALLCAAGVLPIAMFATAAQAADQEADATSGGIEEIVVTAQKTAQNLRDVPLSISAFNSASLERRNIVNLVGVGAIEPGMQIANNQQRLEVTIRGIGAASPISPFEQPVAVHIDGVYQARGSGITGTFFDVERVEVLKGPQGTLYGRNATGGAVNIIMKRPSREFEFEARAEGIYIDDTGTGNDTGYILGAMANVPIGDNVQTRFSILNTDRGGYKTIVDANNNKRDGENAKNISLRGQINIDFSDSASWLVTADYFHADDRSAYTHIFGRSRPDFELTGVLLGGRNCGKCRISYSDYPIATKITNWGVTSELSGELSDSLTAKMLTSYRKINYFYETDFDGTEINLGNNDLPHMSKQFTNEVQLAGRYGAFKFIAGVFYFRERINIETNVPFPILPDDPVLGPQGVFLGGRIKTDAWAVFGEVTYDVTPEFGLVVGGRYSHEKKGGAQNIINTLPSFGPAFVNSIIGPVPSKTFTSFTPKVGLNFKPNDDLLVYASFSKGFKSGGYSIGAAPSAGTTALADSFNPEKVDAYEVGLKASGLDNRLQVNVAGFYYDYSELQLESILGNSTVIRNSGKARIYGVEGSVTALPTREWRINLSGTLMRARYSKSADRLLDPLYPELGPQDLNGRHLPRAPELSATFNTEYTIGLGGSGDLTPSFTAAWKSRQWFTPFNQAGIEQAGYWWLNAAVTYNSPDRRYSLQFYGDNLTNKLVYTGLFPGSVLFGYQLQGLSAPPRVFGVRATMKM